MRREALQSAPTLGGGDYDYDQTYDDIGGIYDSCDDYNYDSDPADDIRSCSFLFSPVCRR